MCSRWRIIFLHRVSVVQRPSARRKPVAKFKPTMPRFANGCNCSSVRLRDEADNAWALECVATSGALKFCATSQNPLFRDVRTSSMMRKGVAGSDQGLSCMSAPARIRRRRKPERHARAKHIGPRPYRARANADPDHRAHGGFKSGAIASAPSMWVIPCPALPAIAAHSAAV